jgi:hypothetical protein
MIADSIAKYLQSLNVGKINKDIFIDFQPDEPDDCITIYNSSAPVLEESNGLNIDNAGIQILIRDNNYNNAKLKAQNIYSYLVALSGDIEGSLITFIEIETYPQSLGKDEKSRNEFSMYFNVRYENLTLNRI